MCIAAAFLREVVLDGLHACVEEMLDDLGCILSIRTNAQVYIQEPWIPRCVSLSRSITYMNLYAHLL
jgi:hypothetical protein